MAQQTTMIPATFERGDWVRRIGGDERRVGKVIDSSGGGAAAEHMVYAVRYPVDDAAWPAYYRRADLEEAPELDARFAAATDALQRLRDRLRAEDLGDSEVCRALDAVAEAARRVGVAAA